MKERKKINSQIFDLASGKVQQLETLWLASCVCVFACEESVLVASSMLCSSMTLFPSNTRDEQNPNTTQQRMGNIGQFCRVI